MDWSATELEELAAGRAKFGTRWKDIWLHSASLQHRQVVDLKEKAKRVDRDCREPNRKVPGTSNPLASAGAGVLAGGPDGKKADRKRHPADAAAGAKAQQPAKSSKKGKAKAKAKAKLAATAAATGAKPAAGSGNVFDYVHG